jgi:hypothetical protein
MGNLSKAPLIKASFFFRDQPLTCFFKSNSAIYILKSLTVNQLHRTTTERIGITVNAGLMFIQPSLHVIGDAGVIAFISA